MKKGLKLLFLGVLSCLPLATPSMADVLTDAIAKKWYCVSNGPNSSFQGGQISLEWNLSFASEYGSTYRFTGQAQAHMVINGRDYRTPYEFRGYAFDDYSGKGLLLQQWFIGRGDRHDQWPQVEIIKLTLTSANFLDGYLMLKNSTQDLHITCKPQ